MGRFEQQKQLGFSCSGGGLKTSQDAIISILECCLSHIMCYFRQYCFVVATE